MKRSTWLIGAALVVAISSGVASWFFFLKPTSNIARLAEISRARKLRDWPEVERLSRQWCLDEPDSASAWLEAAEAAEMQGAIEREASYLEQIPTSDPRAAASLMLLANIYFDNLNQPLKGVATCERALKVDPKLREAHRRLIFFYAMTLQHEKLTKQVNIAINLGCDSPETYVYLVGNHWLIFSNGVQLNQKWQQSAPDNEVFTIASLVHELSSPVVTPDRGNELEARMYAALEKYPNNVELLTALLSRKTQSGESEEVIVLLSKVPAEARNDSRVWYYAGWLQDYQSNLDEAETSFRKSLELDPYDYVTRLALASTTRRQGDVVQAEKLTEVAVQGKELRSRILVLSNVASLDKADLESLGKYARDCGVDRVAERLELRLAQFTSAPR